MGFSANSTIRQVLADENAKAAVEKVLPGFSNHPQLYMALDMTLKEVSWYPESGLTQAKLKEVVDALESLD